MRLFVALPLPEVHRRELAARIAALRETGPRARWEDPEKLHLTLAFLGEVERERLAELAAALRAACARFPPLHLRLGAPGAFPTRQRARVLWIALEGDERLAALQGAVAGACEPFLERREERPFHPHVTLARCDPPWKGAEVDRFAARLARAPSGHLAEPFVAREVVLIESELGQGGARHSERERLPLPEGDG